MASLTAERRAGNTVPFLVLGGMLLTIAVGLTARWAGVGWGAPAQPLDVLLVPALSTWAIVSAVVLTASVLAAVWLFRSDVGNLAFAAVALALTLVTRLALNVVRAGPHDLYAVFISNRGEGKEEYLPALDLVHRMGAGSFLRNFSDLIPTLPVHAAGNPPGLLLTINALEIDTAQGLAALTIVVGALATPALYILARGLYEETTARVATLLFVFVPTSLVYGATSADAMYVTLGVVAAALLLAKKPWLLLAGAVLLAVASFFSYALLAVGAWAAIVCWRRDGAAAALRLAMICAAVLAVFYVALDLVAGFNLFEVIRATDERYREGIARLRPYLFYLFGSPAAFLFMLGPVAWFGARSLGAREASAIALAVVIAVAAIGGYTKAETERIWIFFVPLACLAAARSFPTKRLPIMLAAMTSQAVLIEALLFTKF